MRSLLVLLIPVLAVPAFADVSIDARVVSIYRPLEMKSRRVKVERKVFIQSNTELDFPEKLVGQTLSVYRLRKVPAQVSMHPSGQSVDLNDKATEPTLVDTGDAEKSPELAPLDGGRPAGFAAPSKRQLTKTPMHLGAETSRGDLVTNIQEEPVEAAVVKSRVGQIKVLSVEGNVAIAVVLSDGIRDASKGNPSVRKVEGSTVSAGDFAEGVLKKIIPKKNAKPLSASEKKALRSERDRIRKMNKTKKKRGKYRRKTMQWDL